MSLPFHTHMCGAYIAPFPHVSFLTCVFPSAGLPLDAHTLSVGSSSNVPVTSHALSFTGLPFSVSFPPWALPSLSTLPRPFFVCAFFHTVSSSHTLGSPFSRPLVLPYRSPSLQSMGGFFHVSSPSWAHLGPPSLWIRLLLAFNIPSLLPHFL